MRIGMIGLGSMGQPMARRLARAGFSVVAYNRTRARVEALLPDNVEVADTPAEACAADILISMVSDDAAIEQLFFRDGRFLTMGRPGLVHIGMSTVSDSLARRLTESHRQHAQQYVSAPVFGPPEAAHAGKLFIAAAGPATAIDKARPAFAALGRLDVVGVDPATANIVKLAGNFLLATVFESLRDSLSTINAAGADPRQFAGIVTQALFPTTAYQVLGGSLAKQVHEKTAALPNPFAKSAAIFCAAADRLGVKVRDLPDN
jgi:3-hydroxyisobutyrate dehydrogenase-like beta-hydroxyacid dehydrogenase